MVAGLALSTGACGVPVAVSAASYAADGGLMVASEKTSTDHLASVVTKQDCAMWRILRGRQICKEREGDSDPYDVNYNEPQRSVSEAGVQYGPPLRSAADVPATSWDAAAYKTEPAPAVQGPMTAAADGEVEATTRPASAPVASQPAKVRKVKTARSAKKPSRDRVASAP